MATSTAALLVSLDTTVNIAFPAITATFKLEVSQIQWVVVSYVLTLASLLLATGRLSDAFGHRRILTVGLTVTGAGVALCGFAPDFGWFLAARVVQGGGAALVLGAAPALVTVTAPEQARSRALGVFQAGAAIGVAVGPVLGGALIEWTTWRAVYLFRVPVAVLVLAVVFVVVPKQAYPARIGPPRRNDAPLDLAGALLLGTGLAAGLLAFGRVRETGWSSALVATGFVASAALLVTWVFVERRSRNPVVDLTLLRHPPFAVANGLNVVANGTMFAIWLLAPYYLLNIRGLSTITGGLVLGMTPLGAAIVSPLAGSLDGHISTRRRCTTGLALEALGLATVATTGTHTPLLLVAMGFTLVGVGLGLFTVPNLSYVMGSTPGDRQGVAGGLTQVMRTVGIVVGVAGASLVFDARRHRHTDDLSVAADDPKAFVAAFRDTFILVTGLCAIAAFVSLLRTTSNSAIAPVRAPPRQTRSDRVDPQ